MSNINKKEQESQKDNQIFNNIFFYSFLIILLVSGLYLSYMNPETFMTNAAKELEGKEYVTAQNVVRGNVLSVGGAIFVFGTLWIKLTQLKLEKQREWKPQVEAFYGEWAGIFLSLTRAGELLAKAKHYHNEEEARLQQLFDNYDLQRRQITFKILMLEQRPNVIEKFKEINKYSHPHYPIVKQIKNEQEKFRKSFWDMAYNDEHIIGYFYGVTQQRLMWFCDWISNPEEKLEMPNFDDYLKYVKMKIPALAKQIETILNSQE